MTVSCFRWAHTILDVKSWLSVTKAVSMYNKEPKESQQNNQINKQPNKQTENTN